MSLLFRSRPREVVEERAVRIPRQYLEQHAWMNATGVSVNQESALRSSAVWACVNLIAETASMLPRDVVRYEVGGNRVEVTPTPTLVGNPSWMVDANGWVYQVVASWLLDGNFYGRVTETSADMRRIVRCEVLNPSTVSWSTDGAGVLRPHINGQGQDLWPVGDLWHVPAKAPPGSPVGMSIIEMAAESIGLNLAARKFGAQFFGDGAHPTHAILLEDAVDEEVANRIKDRFLQATRGNRTPIVMSKGKIAPLQIAPEESQFLDSQRYTVEDIARFFRIPPEMIGGASSGSNITYATLEQRGVDFLTFGLDPWLTRLERMLTDQLPRPQVVKVNRSAVLRTDTMTRYGAHQIALQNGWRSINEVRRLEDEPEIGPAGDAYKVDAVDAPDTNDAPSQEAMTDDND